MPRRLGVVVVLFFSLSTVSVARATWLDTERASATYSTATLAPPTSPVATAGTCALVVGDATILAWTATPSVWADGYQIARSLVSGGPYTDIATVAGRTTVSYTDSGLLFSTTYHYVVRATKGAWRSVNTAQVSRTTRSALCA